MPSVPTCCSTVDVKGTVVTFEVVIVMAGVSGELVFETDNSGNKMAVVKLVVFLVTEVVVATGDSVPVMVETVSFDCIPT